MDEVSFWEICEKHIKQLNFTFLLFALFWASNSWSKYTVFNTHYFLRRKVLEPLSPLKCIKTDKRSFLALSLSIPKSFIHVKWCFQTNMVLRFTCKSHFPIPCMKRNNPDEIFMYSLSIADGLLIHRFHSGAFCILLIFFYLGRRSFLLYRFKNFLLLSSVDLYYISIVFLFLSFTICWIVFLLV